MIGIIESVRNSQDRFREENCIEVVVRFTGAPEDLLEKNRELMRVMREQQAVLVVTNAAAPDWVKKMEGALK